VPEQQPPPAQAAPQPEQRPVGTPQGAAQQHAATGQLTPVAEHGEARRFTRSAAKARAPEGASLAVMALDPAATEVPNTSTAAAAPMSGRKRSLRSNSRSPAAAPAVPGAGPAALEEPVAAGPVAAAAAAQQPEDPCQAAKRRARPRKSGLHAGLPARVPVVEAGPSAAGSLPAPDLTASAVFVGATAALLSAAAALQAPQQAAAGSGALSTVPEAAAGQEQQEAPAAVLPASSSAVPVVRTAPQAAAGAEPVAAAKPAAALAAATASAESKPEPAAQQLLRRSSVRHKGLTIPQR
jgi:ribonuclease E